MRNVLIGSLLLMSFSSFAKTNCAQEIEALKTHLLKLESYDKSAYKVLNNYSYQFTQLANMPVANRGSWINEFRHYPPVFKEKRLELRYEIKIAVADIERCINQ